MSFRSEIIVRREDRCKKVEKHQAMNGASEGSKAGNTTCQLQVRECRIVRSLGPDGDEIVKSYSGPCNIEESTRAVIAIQVS